MKPLYPNAKALGFLGYLHNIREGGDGRLPGIAAIIRQQPDAVALLEVTSRANALTLAQDLEMQLVFGDANNSSHVAWLSRLPIQRERNHRLAVLAKTLLEIEVVWEGAPLRLFATHVASRWDGRQTLDRAGLIHPCSIVNATALSGSTGQLPHVRSEAGRNPVQRVALTKMA